MSDDDEMIALGAEIGFRVFRNDKGRIVLVNPYHLGCSKLFKLKLVVDNTKVNNNEKPIRKN